MESAAERFLRFNKAKEKAAVWRAKLAKVYKYIFPYKNYFNARSQPIDSSEVFDMTAVVAAQDFANNFQTIMLPPYRRWANLTNGLMLTEELEARGIDQTEIKKKFQEITEMVFRCIHASNFNLAIHEALLDFCVGTGVILINETNDSSVIDVHSVPISEVYFEEGRFDNLENFWREQKLTNKQILRNWPNAKLTEQMQRDDKDKEFELIEGVIFYPEKEQKEREEHGEKESDAYYYYIQDKESQKEIFSEWRDYCPFIGFRYSRSSGDLVGHGLAEFALSFIKVVNEIAKLDLQALQFKTQPAYMYNPRKVSINPSNFNIEPGTFFPVDLDGGAPIAPFPLPNESRFSRLSIAELQKTIKDIFLSNWLENELRTPNMTATEIAIRQQEFIRRMGGAIGRFAQEFIKPFLTACLKILRRKGKLNYLSIIGQEVGLKINDQFINIEYDSPLITLQNQQDVDSVLSFIATNVQLFQGNAMLALNLPEIPTWLANKKGVDLTLVNKPEEIAKAFKDMRMQLQEQAQPPAPQATPLEQPGRAREAEPVAPRRIEIG